MAHSRIKIIATDIAHAALPVLSLLSKKPNVKDLKIGKNISSNLDGLECMLPVLVSPENHTEDKVRRFYNTLQDIRESVNPFFNYYAFHGLYEKQSGHLNSTSLNLADNNTSKKAKDLERKLLHQMEIVKSLSYAKKPILNIHGGWVPEEFDKHDRINNLHSILDECRGKYGDILICVENIPPAKKGYNLFQNPSDFLINKAKSFNITYDISHLECTRYNGPKKDLSSAENIEDFKNYHETFLSEFGDRICYMHWSLNDISLLSEGEALDPYYETDRHCPPSRFKDTIFLEEAFEPVSKKAFNTIQSNMDGDAYVNAELPRKIVSGKTFCSNGATEQELIESYQYAGRLAADLDAKKTREAELCKTL